MADLHELRLVVDRDQPLGPQLEKLRAEGVPWKLIERLTGKRKTRLEEYLARWRSTRRASEGPRANLPSCR